jgi:hypothetical protein
LLQRQRPPQQLVLGGAAAEALQQFCRTRAIASARDQEADRFGQKEERDRTDQQRQSAADDEHRLPAEPPDERRGEQAREYRPDGRHRVDQNHQERPTTLRREFIDQGDHVGDGASHAKAGDEAERRQRGEVSGERREQTADGANDEHPQQRRAATEPVAHPACDRRTERHADERCGKREPEARRWQAPVGRDGRYDETK